MYVPSQYTALFSEAWIWKEWLERGALGYRLRDTGIDMLARSREEEGFCAIRPGSFLRFHVSGLPSCLRCRPRFAASRSFWFSSSIVILIFVRCQNSTNGTVSSFFMFFSFSGTGPASTPACPPLQFRHRPRLRGSSRRVSL
ncbi:MAG: hypothetical protein AB7U27_09325 [Aminobacteriaceae bacterium]